MSAKTRDRVSGVLLLDKPLDMTSSLAVQIAKRVMNARKAGHTGTLDPKASGLLPIAFGDATKWVASYIEERKSYEATLCLGVVTTTDDTEGEVVKRQDVDLTLEDIKPILERFTGEIEQIPPMHSAIKVDGQALYFLARQGIEVERKARPVTIFSIVVLSFEAPYLKLAVTCSKGTYIRVLAKDIGEALGCGAHLSALRRTMVGGFRIEEAATFEALETIDIDARRAKLLAADVLIADMPALHFDAVTALRLVNGQRLNLGRKTPDAIYRLYNDKSEFLGTGRVKSGILSPDKMLSTSDD